MDAAVYLKFNDPNFGKELPKPMWPWNIFSSFILYIFPNLNPELKFNKNIKYWLVEFDADMYLPQRELAFDSEANLINGWPSNNEHEKNNYGFWTDSNIDLEYCLDNFNPEVINKDSFEKEWDKFMQTS